LVFDETASDESGSETEGKDVADSDLDNDVDGVGVRAPAPPAPDAARDEPTLQHVDLTAGESPGAQGARGKTLKKANPNKSYKKGKNSGIPAAYLMQTVLSAFTNTPVSAQLPLNMYRIITPNNADCAVILVRLVRTP
jgi:hypothetical protein